MKKLNKITLQQKGQVLKPGEMKSIVGGYGNPNYGYGDQPYFKCMWKSTDISWTNALVFANSCYEAEYLLKMEITKQLREPRNDVVANCSCNGNYY